MQYIAGAGRIAGKRDDEVGVSRLIGVRCVIRSGAATREDGDGSSMRQCRAHDEADVLKRGIFVYRRHFRALFRRAAVAAVTPKPGALGRDHALHISGGVSEAHQRHKTAD